MAADDSQAALLIDEEDQGWDDLEDVEDQVTDKCTVVELLDEHPNDIIRYVQVMSPTMVLSGRSHPLVSSTEPCSTSGNPGLLCSGVALQSKGVAKIGELTAPVRRARACHTTVTLPCSRALQQ